MAISYVGKTSGYSANTANGSWSLPADWRVGELGIFFWYSRADSTFAPPAGITTILDSNPAGDYGHMYIGGRYLVAGDATFSWTATTGTNQTSGWICAVFGGTQYGVNMVENVAAAVALIAGEDSIAPPDVTIGHTGDLAVVFCGATDDFSTGPNAPTTFTEVYVREETGGNDAGFGMAYKLALPAGTLSSIGSMGSSPGAGQAYTISLCYQNPYGVVPSASTVRSHLYASEGVQTHG